MLSPPSHNLNILIVDKHDNKIENQALLENIYDEITGKKIIKKGKLLDSKLDVDIDVCLYWQRMPVTKEEQHFMGELFLVSAYSDKVLHIATHFLLIEIEHRLKNFTTNKNWKIIFHISKLLENTG
jgi:hypothetical protein